MELSRLNSSLVAEIRGNPRITIVTSAQVEDVRWYGNTRLFEVDVQLPDKQRTYSFEQVIQAGWSQGLSLDLKLVNNLRREKGMPELSAQEYAGETLHRLKVFALVNGVDIDDTVTHQMMMSPEAAQYGYLGDGVGIASANHLEVIDKAQGVCPMEWESVLNGQDGRVHEVAQAIFKYCQPYFPFLKDATCVKGYAAVVVSGLDVGKRSAETLRKTGVEAFGVTGYHSVSGMKLSNIPVAAVTVLRAVLKAAGDHDVDTNEPAEQMLRRFSQSNTLRVKPAPLSPIEQMVAGGPLEEFRHGSAS